jgi:hypothetical protein
MTEHKDPVLKHFWCLQPAPKLHPEFFIPDSAKHKLTKEHKEQYLSEPQASVAS